MSHFPGYQAVDRDGDILMADAHPVERLRLDGFDRVYTANNYLPPPQSSRRQPYLQGSAGTNQSRMSRGSERPPRTSNTPSLGPNLPTPSGNHLRHLPLPFPSRVPPHFFPQQPLRSPTPADAKGPSLPPLTSIIANPYNREELDHRGRHRVATSNDVRDPEYVDLTQSPPAPRTGAFFLPRPNLFPYSAPVQVPRPQQPGQFGHARTPVRGPPPVFQPAGQRIPPITQLPRPRYPPPTPSAPKASCTACFDEFKRDDLLALACNHLYCTPCLNLSFKAGCADMASFPPNCCGRPLRISTWGALLDADVLDRYKKIEAEFGATRPFYCAAPKCSTFIPEDAVLPGEAVGVCPKCSDSTCKNCKRLMSDHDHNQWLLAHRVCPKEDEDLTKLYELGCEKKWKQCPSCMNMVEKADGCNHMDCICGVEFCYRCGKLFDEEDDCECEPNPWGEDEENSDAGLNDEDDEDGDGDESDDEWPDFRVAVDPAGRPRCLHPHTASLGTMQFFCHGCLQPNILLTCADCALELCQTCVDRVRNPVSADSDTDSDDDSEANSNESSDSDSESIGNEHGIRDNNDNNNGNSNGPVGFVPFPPSRDYEVLGHRNVAEGLIRDPRGDLM